MSVADKNTRAFVTPEGVDLRLQIGDGGQRAACDQQARDARLVGELPQPAQVQRAVAAGED